MSLRLLASAFVIAVLAAANSVAPGASATHVRPKAATPLSGSLVPALVPCGAPNRVHAAPLAYGSCNPPVQTSPNVTIGTPDANGAPAQSVGSFEFQVTNGPGAADADVLISVDLTDMRCSGSTGCGAANAVAGPDYTGVLLMTSSYEVTDHNNATCLPTCPGPPTGPFTDAATGTYPSLPIIIPCAGTASTAIGSTCSTTTTMNSVVPGAFAVEGKRVVMAPSQIRVFDGGPTGGAPPGSLFGVQGIFIP
jgi:hypothetical protein